MPDVDSCARLAIALEMPVRDVLAAARRLEAESDGAPPPTTEDVLARARPELKRAERVALALSRKPEPLEQWLGIGEALAKPPWRGSARDP